MSLRVVKKRFSTVRREHEADKKLLIAIGILLIFGLVMLFSASSVVSYARFGNTYHYSLHQLLGLAIGLGFFIFFFKKDYHTWGKLAFPLLIFSIFLLLLVFIPGIRSEHGTARSWINIFGYSLQPSEFVKISFLIYLAAWVEVKKNDLGSLSGGIIPFVIILGIISYLMYIQPDLGTLSIIIVSSFAAFFVGGGRPAHIFIMGLLGALLLFVFLSNHASYQADRFKCLKDPSYSANDKCYQINQSLIAVGSGSWFGRGVGQSRQKFMYLPEVWGDSIFPIIAEEIGFVFSSLLILLYIFIFYRGFLIARYAPDVYGTTLAMGIIVWFAFQTFLNIAGMINLVPMTGVPLPFISAGGSSLVASLIAVGILANISKQTKEG